MRANESQLLRTRSRIAQIREADTAYYKFDRPILSNRECDLLTERRRNGIRESKSGRFRRAAKARVNKIIKAVRLLGDCSNPAAYSEKTLEQHWEEIIRCGNFQIYFSARLMIHNPRVLAYSTVYAVPPVAFV